MDLVSRGKVLPRLQGAIFSTRITDFVARFPLSVPIAHDAEQTVTHAPLHVTRLPTLLIVDADGVIRHRLDEPGERDYDRLDELVAQ